ncbi:hypothetical protein Dimus_028410 [Dionaea muscipula]
MIDRHCQSLNGCLNGWNVMTTARGLFVTSELQDYDARAVCHLRTTRLRCKGYSSPPNCKTTARGPVVTSALQDYRVRAVHHPRTTRLQREGRSSSSNYKTTARGPFVTSELQDYDARAVRHLRTTSGWLNSRTIIAKLSVAIEIYSRHLQDFKCGSKANC